LRLETISRSLSEAFRQAGDRQRQRAAALACEIAVSQSGLCGNAVDAALKLLRDWGTELDVQREIGALIERLDDEYLQLWDQAEPAEKLKALTLFRKARAAAALSFALSGDPERLHEAIYEAAFASDDWAGVLRSVEMELCKDCSANS
jgi:hypothetical protein